MPFPLQRHSDSCNRDPRHCFSCLYDYLQSLAREVRPRKPEPAAHTDVECDHRGRCVCRALVGDVTLRRRPPSQ